MRKCLLVTFIGMVLAINLYGFVKHIIDQFEEPEMEVNKGYTTVIYME